MACDCYVLFAINILRFLELCNPKAHSIFRPLGEFCVVFEHMSVLQCIFRKIIQLTRTAAELYYVLIRIVLYYVLFLYYVLCNPEEAPHIGFGRGGTVRASVHSGRRRLWVSLCTCGDVFGTRSLISRRTNRAASIL